MSFLITYVCILAPAVGYAVIGITRRYREKGTQPSPILLVAVTGITIVALAPPTFVLLYVAGAAGDIILQLQGADWALAVAWPWLTVFAFTASPDGLRRWIPFSLLWLGTASIVASGHGLIPFDAARWITILGFVATIPMAMTLLVSRRK